MIVIFGGAFNPPTIAHDKVARHVLALPNVTELIFVPVGDHYEKPDLIPAIYRIQMLEMMTKNLRKTSVSKIEVNATKPLKTIETLKRLQSQHVATEFAFLMGADNLTQLKKWYDYRELINTFKMIIINRNELDINAYIKNHFSDVAEQFIIVENFDELTISSTQYRHDTTKTEILLPEVEKYISEKGLYQ